MGPAAIGRLWSSQVSDSFGLLKQNLNRRVAIGEVRLKDGRQLEPAITAWRGKH